MNFCRSTPCCGLLDNLHLCWNVIFAYRIPLTITPKIFGPNCALLTGHCRLQLHLYKLNLTFSLTCICLMSDESPQHYLHECPLYDDVRLRSPPNCSNWTSMAQFMFLAGRKPWCNTPLISHVNNCLYHFLTQPPLHFNTYYFLVILRP